MPQKEKLKHKCWKTWLLAGHHLESGAQQEPPSQRFVTKVTTLCVEESRYGQRAVPLFVFFSMRFKTEASWQCVKANQVTGPVLDRFMLIMRILLHRQSLPLQKMFWPLITFWGNLLPSSTGSDSELTLLAGRTSEQQCCIEIDPVPKVYRVPTWRDIFTTPLLQQRNTFCFGVGPSSRPPGRSPVTLPRKLPRQLIKSGVTS